MASPFIIKEHILPASHIREYPHGTSRSQDDILQLSVKQYTPKDNPDPQRGDITIISAHANGFPKELYEPLWAELHRMLKAKGIKIRNIYIADTAWQGQSGVLNASKLGNEPSWFDYARDILHIINLLRPQPPLLAIGHSFGANALVNVSRLHPRLFRSIIVFDPVFDQAGMSEDGPHATVTRLSLRRRDVWPNRDEARRKFLESPFYRSWDDRVFDLWMQYGVRSLESSSEDTGLEGGDSGSTEEKGPVTLTTTKNQEFFTFARPSFPAFDAAGKKVIRPHLVPDIEPPPGRPIYERFPFYRPESSSTLQFLPRLRPSVLYVFGEDSVVCPPRGRKEKVETTGVGVGGNGGVKAGAVEGRVMKGRGHLIPMEDPEGCAAEMTPWVESMMEKWRVEDGEYQEWTRRSQKEKAGVSEEMLRVLGLAKTKGKKRSEKL